MPLNVDALLSLTPVIVPTPSDRILKGDKMKMGPDGVMIKCDQEDPKGYFTAGEDLHTPAVILCDGNLLRNYPELPEDTPTLDPQLQQQIDRMRTTLDSLEEYGHALSSGREGELSLSKQIMARLNDDLDNVLEMASNCHEY